jgi:pimeloyl-ACP methyl ester carboxylesterase
MKIFLRILKWTVLSFLGLLAIVIALNYHSDIPLEVAKEKYTYTDSKFLKANGVELHYRSKGSGEPILLIHGNGASLHTWELWMNQIPDSFQVVALDLPGFGLSGTFNDGNYSNDNYVKTLAEFMVLIEIDNAVVAGNSFGGGLTWKLAHDYPQLVSKMALLDASGYPRTTLGKPTPIAFRLARMPIIKDLMTKVTPRSLFESSLKNAIADDALVDEKYVDRHFELFLKEGNRKVFGEKNSYPSTIEYEKIKSIKQPALIMWGEEDTFVPVENAYKFQTDLENNKLIIYPNIGHIPMEEIPTQSFMDFYNFVIN